MAPYQRPLYALFASLLDARENCRKSGNNEWLDRHTDRLHELEKEYLPHGSGIDAQCFVDLAESRPNRLVIPFDFHHMDENGYYDGWTSHTAVVTPSLANQIDIRITGRDRNQIKDYLHEVFYNALHAVVPLPQGGKDA